MPNRSPHEVTSGSVLADDVYNLDARLLFPAGTELTDKKIEILMMWGVESVHLQGEAGSEKSVSINSFSDTAKHDAKLEVQRRFKLVKSSHPVVVAIREMAILESAKSSDHSPKQQ
ncbi:hypothetical protein [Pelagicoccus sp. SDUM812002]|uniref:hypothetical protein n=1 Tax=Pelagicoccus sp. SDUM812002 TaxID=3041266 RepID=UPI00280EFEE9|nr:hypothetical protein [Pelagicoccus sp. SDUM812002]MDQ8187576.1 hypothetical protein [Pelagicoccus sp. SDUM812002]